MGTAARPFAQKQVSRAVRFKPAAERDIEFAFAWYEQRRDGLGDEFLEEIGEAITQIAASPGLTSGRSRSNKKSGYSSLSIPHLLHHRSKGNRGSRLHAREPRSGVVAFVIQRLTVRFEEVETWNT